MSLLITELQSLVPNVFTLRFERDTLVPVSDTAREGLRTAVNLLADPRRANWFHSFNRIGYGNLRIDFPSLLEFGTECTPGNRPCAYFRFQRIQGGNLPPSIAPPILALEATRLALQTWGPIWAD